MEEIAMTLTLKVDSIRPDSLAAQVAEAQRLDTEWLEGKKGTFEEGDCPVCQKKAASKPAYQLTNGLTYHICTKCATLFLKNRPDADGYEEFYKSSAIMKLFATAIFPQSNASRIENIYKPRLQKLLDYYVQYSNKKGNFIEIGAGSGMFSELVKESKKFSRCLVVEPSPYLAESCRQKGLDVIEKSIENVSLSENEYFSDVVLAGCFELLEHLLNPAIFVKKIYSVLPPGGLFCLSTPNGRGFDILELKEKSTTLGLTHVNLFNPESLTLLLEQTGFKVLEISTPGRLDVDLVYREFKADGIEKNNSWLRHFLLTATDGMKEELQQVLINTKQSSHMWAICQK